MSKVRLFFIRKWIWAKENNVFWINFIIFIVVAYFVFHGISEFWLKTIALLLQLFGVLTVWHDLTKARKDFGKIGFLKYTAEWLRRGLWGRPVIKAMSSKQSTTLSANVAGIARCPITKEASLEQRVTALERNQKHIDEDLSSLSREIDKTRVSLEERITLESQKVESCQKEANEIIKSLVTDGYYVLACGIFWLIIGMIISTYPSEIVIFFNEHRWFSQ